MVQRSRSRHPDAVSYCSTVLRYFPVRAHLARPGRHRGDWSGRPARSDEVVGHPPLLQDLPRVAGHDVVPVALNREYRHDPCARAHGGERGARKSAAPLRRRAPTAGVRPIGAAGVDRDGGEQVGMGGAEHAGHGSAARHACDIDPGGVDRGRAPGQRVADHPRDRGRIAAAARRVGRGAPATAAVGGRIRVHDDEVVALGLLVQLGGGLHLLGGRAATVQHHDQRRRPRPVQGRGRIDERAVVLWEESAGRPCRERRPTWAARWARPEPC